MTQARVLAHYCSEKETIISADASSYGLGAVLLQVQDDDTKKPIAYASRSMTSTEQKVRPDRERSTRNYLGLRKVCRLSPR